MALYNADGQMNLTAVDGLTYTGASAPDGSYYIVLNNGLTYTGYRHPCGAINAVVNETTTNASAPNGSIYVRTQVDGVGYTPSTVLGRAASGPIALAYEQIVGSNGRVSAGTQATIATTTQLETRRLSVLGGQAVASLRLAYANYYVDTNGAEQTVGNGYTLEAAVEIPTAPITSCVRVTFSGSNTGTVADGADIFLSDVIPASAFGLVTIPAGTTIYIHDSVVVTSGQNIPITNPYTPSAGEKSVQNNNGVSQVMTTGVPTGTEVNLQSPLIAVLGKFMAPEVSLALFGDSIENYLNDTNSSGISGTTGGMYVRAAWGVNGRNIPWSNISRTNSLAVTASNTAVKRLAVLRYATHMLTNYGTNDVLAGTASATIQQSLQRLWTIGKSFGVSRVEQAVILPRTTSLDGWTTSTQTPQTNYGAGGIRETLNTAIIGNVGSNNLDAILDLNSVLQDQAIIQSWKTPTARTDDGTHPFGVGLSDGATYLNTRFATYTPAAVINSTYDTATSTVLSAMTSQTNARALLIDNLIRGLKGYGIWNQLDALYMFAAIDSASSRINWKNPGTFNATVAGSPTFTVDRGFTGNATDGAINTNFIPSTAGGVYTQNSAHVAVWILNSLAANANTRAIGNIAAGSTPRNDLLVRNAGDIIAPIMNDATFGTGTNTSTPGFYVMRRTASNARSVIKDATTPVSDAIASNGLPTQAICYLADGATFSALQVATGSIGVALGFQDVQNYRGLLLAYLKAVGAQ